MNEGLIPRRYAKALLEFAKERNSDHRLYGLMDNLTHSFAANPDLEVIMANPFVAPDRKEQLLMTAAGAGSDDVHMLISLSSCGETNGCPWHEQ